MKARLDTWVGCVSLPTEWFVRSAISSSFPTRYERLEEQLNDLTELHQNEMTNLKQELASMEEKVAYQSYERARDIQVWPRMCG